MKIVSDIKQVVVPRRLRVGVVSDSQLTPFRHNEPTTFESNLLAACRTLKEQECAFVVFAGDICNRASKNGYETFKRCFNTVFGDDKPIVQAIMGNHDYYGTWDKPDDLIEPINIAIRPNVQCCSNVTVRLGDTDFICSTLWSNILPQQAIAVNSMLLDFKAIYFGRNKLTVEQYNEMHAESLAFVKEAVETSDAEHIVVVTHHVPTEAVTADKYKGSPLSSGFTTELGDWIADSRIDYWIYGHSHTSIETSIGNTKIVSNQFGYIDLGEGSDFVPTKAFEI